MGGACQREWLSVVFPDHLLNGGLQLDGGRHSLLRMKALATLKMVFLVMAMIGGGVVHGDEVKKEVYEAEGANVRVMRHRDGSKTQMTRSPDNRTIIKIKKNPNGVLTMRTIYRMDENGNPRGCKIYDGQGIELFKVSYGYRKVDGQLMVEYMYDSRTPRMDPSTGKEMPVQKVIYSFDSQGNRSAPSVINLLPGKSFEELFGIKSSEMGENPFRNDAGVKGSGR